MNSDRTVTPRYDQQHHHHVVAGSAWWLGEVIADRLADRAHRRAEDRVDGVDDPERCSSCSIQLSSAPSRRGRVSEARTILREKADRFDEAAATTEDAPASSPIGCRRKRAIITYARKPSKAYREAPVSSSPRRIAARLRPPRASDDSAGQPRRRRVERLVADADQQRRRRATPSASRGRAGNEQRRDGHAAPRQDRGPLDAVQHGIGVQWQSGRHLLQEPPAVR